MSLQPAELLIGQFFGEDELVVGALGGDDQLVEFRLEGEVIPVLGALNQEDHEECNDNGRSVDNELPSIGEAEYWAGHDPCENDSYSNDEEPLPSRQPRKHIEQIF